MAFPGSYQEQVTESSLKCRSCDGTRSAAHGAARPEPELSSAERSAGGRRLRPATELGRGAGPRGGSGAWAAVSAARAPTSRRCPGGPCPGEVGQVADARAPWRQSTTQARTGEGRPHPLTSQLRNVEEAEAGAAGVRVAPALALEEAGGKRRRRLGASEAAGGQSL